MPGKSTFVRQLAEEQGWTWSALDGVDFCPEHIDGGEK